jgi:hypothetical protein
MATPEQEAMERRWQRHEQETLADPDRIGRGLRGWMMCRVDPEVYEAVERAAADQWTSVSDFMRAAIVGRLRAEEWLPPASRAPALSPE